MRPRRALRPSVRGLARACTRRATSGRTDGRGRTDATRNGFTQYQSALFGDLLNYWAYRPRLFAGQEVIRIYVKLFSLGGRPIGIISFPEITIVRNYPYVLTTVPVHPRTMNFESELPTQWNDLSMKLLDPFVQSIRSHIIDSNLHGLGHVFAPICLLLATSPIPCGPHAREKYSP